MSEKIEATQPVEYGAVIHADGSAKPNPGNCGWGIHGFIYKKEEPKKGAGCPDHILAETGYIRKTSDSSNDDGNKKSPKKPIQVTPIKYIDGFGSFGYISTNNMAELVAATRAINYINEKFPECKKLLILTDSSYTIKSANEWIPKYRKRDWVRADGGPIANLNELRALDEAINKMTERGVTLVVDYIEAHVGFIGNEMADRLANVGSNCSARRIVTSSIEASEAEGYWKHTPDRHPFISSRKLYFNTISDYLVPGHYYLGDHGNDDEQAGKKISDAGFAYVELANPDPIVELVRGTQSRVAGGNEALVYARMDYIFNPEVHNQLKRFGENALSQQSMLRYDLVGLNHEPATREFRPPRIADRNIEALNSIANILQWYLEGAEIYRGTDITDILYEKKNDPKKGELFKLRPEYVVGFSALPVQVNYRGGDQEAKDKVILTLGIDMPDRNALKRMEDLKPKVTVVTWMESEKAFRYAVVITTDQDRGIWCGCYSNLRIIN